MSKKTKKIIVIVAAFGFIALTVHPGLALAAMIAPFIAND